MIEFLSHNDLVNNLLPILQKAQFPSEKIDILLDLIVSYKKENSNQQQFDTFSSVCKKSENTICAAK
eukprot:Pgem_evm1s12799